MTDKSQSAKPAGASTPPSDRSARKESAAGIGDTARSAVQEATEAVRDKAAEQTDRAREAVAGEVSGVAQALRTAADELRDGSAQERTFAQIADTLADAAEAIRGKDLGEVVSEASHMARRHPVAFLGGAALLGFTAIRFAKAGRSDTGRRSAHRPEPRPGPTTTPTVPASPEVAEARRMP